MFESLCMYSLQSPLLMSCWLMRYLGTLDCMGWDGNRVGSGALSHAFSSAQPRTLCENQATALGCWVKLPYIFAHSYVLVLMVLYLFSQHNFLSNVVFLEICVCTPGSSGKLFLVRVEYNIPGFSCWYFTSWHLCIMASVRSYKLP